MYKIVEFSHILINDFFNKYKNKDLTFIDATCGMGNDTLFLANLLNNKGSIIAYDIQEIAINSTKEKLSKFNNVIYRNESHENLDNEFDLIIYNLGYLPNHDKTITTTSISTLNSLTKALKLVDSKEDYLIIIVLYPGHFEGKKESLVIDEYCYNLDSSKYLVCKYMNYNRPTSPFIITISKNKFKK